MAEKPPAGNPPLGKPAAGFRKKRWKKRWKSGKRWRAAVQNARKFCGGDEVLHTSVENPRGADRAGWRPRPGRGEAPSFLVCPAGLEGAARRLRRRGTRREGRRAAGLSARDAPPGAAAPEAGCLLERAALRLLRRRPARRKGAGPACPLRRTPPFRRGPRPSVRLPGWARRSLPPHLSGQKKRRTLPDAPLYSSQFTKISPSSSRSNRCSKPGDRFSARTAPSPRRRRTRRSR